MITDIATKNPAFTCGSKSDSCDKTPPDGGANSGDRPPADGGPNKTGDNKTGDNQSTGGGGDGKDKPPPAPKPPPGLDTKDLSANTGGGGAS
ncbi:hypothetical protein [Mycobacterium sp. URHB0021]